jgi:hypothetical protein
MSYATAGSSAAAAHAAMANAVKASGAIVRLEVSDFEAILNKTKDPLVIYTKGGFLSANHQYLTSYKGFVFFAKCSEPINLPSSAEVVQSKRIWIPS